MSHMWLETFQTVIGQVGIYNMLDMGGVWNGNFLKYCGTSTDVPIRAHLLVVFWFLFTALFTAGVTG